MAKQVQRLEKVIVLLGSLILLLLIGGLWMAFSPQPVAAGFTPTPEPTSRPPHPSDGGEGDHEPDDPCRQGSIWGTVTDLCMSRPGAGLDVVINGDKVRTDG